MGAPEFGLNGAPKAVHVPSGVGVSPVRTLSARLVPGGVMLVQEAICQVTCWPASKTLESKVHEVAYRLLDVSFVLKMAQSGELLKSTPKPTCSKGVAPKVATNSSERPGTKVAL